MSFYKGKRVLVTGAGGFIGSHLCEALIDEGAELTALLKYGSQSHWGNLEFLPAEKKSKIKVISGNVEDGDFIARQMEGKEVVFHLAALVAIPYSYLATRSYVRTNIEGTLNVLEAARRLGTQRVVHTSTSETYGTAIYSPIDEKHPLQGQSPYSASKIGADKMVESYFLSFGLPVTTVRPFNTFGPRQSARAILPTIISQALLRKEIRLGRLDPIRDMNYVKDTVNGFLRVAECERAIGRTINIGSGQGITVGEMVEMCLKHLDVRLPVVQDDARVRPADSEVLKLVCDASVARDLVGWKSQYSFEQGLKETISFIREHLHLFRADSYTL